MAQKDDPQDVVEDSPRATTTKGGVEVMDLKKFPDPRKLEQLKHWHKVAIILRQIKGLTWQETVDLVHNGKGKHTIMQVSKSPAGQRLLNDINEFMGDSHKVMELLLRDDEVEAYADYQFCRNLARQANDYKMLYAMVKDVSLKRAIENHSSPKSQDKPQIIINMPAGTSELPMLESEDVETSFEVVETKDD